MRVRHAASLLLLLVAAGTASAAPLDLGSPVRYADRRFEWRQEFGRRWNGEYGQARVALGEGVAYEFFTSDAVAGTSNDPFLYVLDEEGVAVLASNDDGGEGRNARIVFTPDSAGTYTVRLRAYRRGTSGSCSITLRRLSDGPASSSVPEISPGDVLTGQVFEYQSAYSTRWSGTYGQYRIRMNANTLYRFEVTDASGADADTFLYLLDDRLRGVWWDDDGGVGYQSKLVFRPTEDGTYLLRLRAYNRGARGTCTLAVSSGERAAEAALLPDLLPWRAFLEDAYISTAGGVRRIRFTTTMVNRGAGALEAFRMGAESDGTARAFQVIYHADGSRRATPVGLYHFHPAHGHWHFEDFADYDLVDPDTGTAVASSGKVSFCMRDDRVYTEESVPGTASRAKYTCDYQGISVGWADVYDASLDGQEIDLTGVADGVYDLVVTANPAARIHEAARANNRVSIRVEISGTSVRIVR